MAVARRVCSIYIEVMLVTVVLVNAQSQECGTSHFKCHGAKQVQQCVDGVPMGDIENCDPGYMCDSSSEWGPCVPEPDDACCGEGLFPVKDSCSLFMSCVHNGLKLTRNIISCAPNFKFNPKKGRCEHFTSSLDFCQWDLQQESSSTSTTVFETSTTESTTTTTTSTTKKPTTTSTRRPSAKICSSPGHYPDPESCRHYYVCSWAAGGGVKATRTQCIANLLFDVRMRQCVYNTNCGTRKFY